jgi:hypothetical protein
MRRFTNKAAAAILVTLVAATSAAPAFAGTLQPSAAVRAAKQAAAKAARQTRASGSRVIGCIRQSRLSFFCRGELRYSKGASKCTIDIKVWYPQASSRALRTSVSNSRCY